LQETLPYALITISYLRLTVSLLMPIDVSS